MTSLRLLAVLNSLSSTPARAKRLAPRPDGPLTHFASPRGEKCRLEQVAVPSLLTFFKACVVVKHDRNMSLRLNADKASAGVTGLD